MDYQTLNLLFRCGREFSHKKILLHDLSETECMICSFLYSHPNCSQYDVALALKIDKTTVAKAILTLEKKDCIRRSKDSADKRINRLSLTETGKKKTGNLLNIHNDWLSEIMTSLSDEEQLQFENCCEKLLTAAEILIKNSGEKQNAQ